MSSQQRANLLGIAAVLLTLLGWSSVPLFVKHFSHALDPWTSNGWRYGISALLWLPVVLYGAWRHNLPKGIWRAAIVPSLFNCCGQVCFTNCFYKIDPGLATFGLRIQIIFVAIGAVLLFPAERLIVRSPGYLIGIAMVLAGSIGVLWLGHAPPQGATAVGVTLAIASGMLFAFYGLSVRHFMHGMPPLTAFAAISQYTAVGMLILMFTLGDNLGVGAWRLSNNQFTLLLVSGIIGIAIGHVAYYYAISTLGVAVSSGVIQLQPFLVAGASYFLFGEQLTAWQWTAGAVAIFGAALILTIQARLHRKPDQEVEAAYESD